LFGARPSDAGFIERVMKAMAARGGQAHRLP